MTQNKIKIMKILNGALLSKLKQEEKEGKRRKIDGTTRLNH